VDLRLEPGLEMHPGKWKSGKLLAAIRRGADLRIATEFRHNEHIDTNSASPELISEVADFRITYVLDDRWVAGIINLRQPIELPNRFATAILNFSV